MLCFSLLLCFYSAVRVKERQWSENDNVVALCRVAFGKDRHLPGNDAAGLMDQLFRGMQGFPGRYDVVEDQDPAVI